jgi:hypothetical protein
MGPRKTWGSIMASVAVASTVAEPVNWVSHQTRANWTTWLPISEIAWPVQMTKKGVID